MTHYVNYYQECFKYISGNRNYIFAVIFIFFTSAVLGAVFHSSLGFIDGILKKIVSNTEGLSTLGIIVFIFFNNLKASLFGMLGGLFFGVFPLINALSNGLVLGYVFEKVSSVSGFGEFWKILPHGIFELPAVFISLGIGVRLGMFIFSRNPRKEFVFNARQALKAFFLVIVPLLAVAAVIEGILIGIMG